MAADLNDFRILVAIADAGSFTAAGQLLGCSKSLVSKRLTQLETHLGVPLLDRTTRSLRLTPAGSAFLGHAREALRSVREAEAAALHYQQGARGTVRIGAPLAFGTRYVSPVLSRFHALYPDVRIDLILDDHPADADSRAFDVSLLIEPPQQKSMVFRRLTRLTSVLCASHAYLEREGTPGSIEQLARHNCLNLYRPGQPSAWKLHPPGGNQQAFEPEGPVRLNNSDALCSAVLGGLGIARLPTFIAGPLILRGELVHLLADHRLGERSLYLSYPEGAASTPAVRAAADFLAEAFSSSSPPWEAGLCLPD